MQNVLVIYYTQSGQLKDIADNIAKPFLEDSKIEVDYLEIKPAQPFPFPWNKEAFFNAFPESFLQESVGLNPISDHILAKKYDLILLHYQVWYLSPSIPINSFLKSDSAKLLMDGVPVVTISGSRNMWFMAQEKVKNLIRLNGGQLKGNIALVDRAGNLVSVVTIVEWMFSGVKKKYLGIFPMPGVSQQDIADAQKFGNIIHSKLKAGDFQNLQPQLVKAGAIKISSYLLTVDRTGNKIFKKWAGFIKKNPESRGMLLKVFYVYLFLAIWVISPIVYILHVLLYPLKINKIRRETLYFQGV